MQIGRVPQTFFVGRIVVEPFSVPIDHRDQVGDIIGNESEKLRALPQLRFGTLPLKRITNRAREHLAVKLAFHEIILRAFANGLERERLIAGTGQHDNRHGGSSRVEFVISGQPRPIRQRQVEQNNFEWPGVEPSQCVVEPPDAGDFELGRRAREFPRQVGMDRLVHRQQHLDLLRVHLPLSDADIP